MLLEFLQSPWGEMLASWGDTSEPGSAPAYWGVEGSSTISISLAPSSASTCVRSRLHPVLPCPPPDVLDSIGTAPPPSDLEEIT